MSANVWKVSSCLAHNIFQGALYKSTGNCASIYLLALSKNKLWLRCKKKRRENIARVWNRPHIDASQFLALRESEINYSFFQYLFCAIKSKPCTFLHTNVSLSTWNHSKKWLRAKSSVVLKPMMTVLTTITKQMSHYSSMLHQLKWFVPSAGGRHQYFIITQTTVINVINGQTFSWLGGMEN